MGGRRAPHHFHLLARRGSLPLLIVTEDFPEVGGAPAVTGGAPLPGDRPLARPMFPNVASRVPPGAALLLLVVLLVNEGMAPLPEIERETSGFDQSVTLACLCFTADIIKVLCTHLVGPLNLNSDWVESFLLDSGQVYPEERKWHVSVCSSQGHVHLICGSITNCELLC